MLGLDQRKPCLSCMEGDARRSVATVQSVRSQGGGDAVGEGQKTAPVACRLPPRSRAKKDAQRPRGGETGTPLKRAARPLLLLSVEPHPPLSRGWHRALASGPVAGSASYTLRSGCDLPAIIPRRVSSPQGRTGEAGEKENELPPSAEAGKVAGIILARRSGVPVHWLGFGFSIGSGSRAQSPNT